MWNLSSVFGQICGTPSPVNPIIYPQENPSLTARGSGSALCISVDVFFHIVRTTNGLYAFVPPTADDIVRRLNRFYSPHNIIINNVGTDFIDDSDLLIIDIDSGERNTLFATQNRSDAINFYIVEDFTGGNFAGMAQSIPSKNLVIRDAYVSSSISAHELGHCLNLYHTFQGTASNTSGCAENINGSNCNTCGDLICDTPADANTGNTGGYNPDLTNIMSYYLPADHFTNGQGYGMRYAIQNESILQSVTGNSCTSISKISNVCYPQTTTINLSDLGEATTIWTTSGNIKIISSNNSDVQIRPVSSNSTGNGWVKATLSNGVTLQEGFKVGVPSFPKNFRIKTTGNGIYVFSKTWQELYAFGGDNIEWSFSTAVMTRSGGPNSILIYPTNTSGSIRVGVRLKNGCGYSQWEYKYFTIYQTPSGGGGIGIAH